jgi:hypothetical protein
MDTEFIKSLQKKERKPRKKKYKMKDIFELKIKPKQKPKTKYNKY